MLIVKTGGKTEQIICYINHHIIELPLTCWEFVSEIKKNVSGGLVEAFVIPLQQLLANS